MRIVRLFINIGAINLIFLLNINFIRIAACNPYDVPDERATRIISYLDDKEAAFINFFSKFPSENFSETDKLYAQVEVFKNNFLSNANVTNKGNIKTLKQLTQSLINLGKNKEALDLCKDFLNKHPECKNEMVGLYYQIGNSFKDSNKYDDAIEPYKEGLLISSDKNTLINSIHINLGWCYYKKSNYKEAIEQYNSILSCSLSPNTTQWVYFEIARCNYFLKNYNDAILAFKEVIKVDPKTQLSRKARTNIEDIEKLFKREKKS